MSIVCIKEHCALLICCYAARHKRVDASNLFRASHDRPAPRRVIMWHPQRAGEEQSVWWEERVRGEAAGPPSQESQLRSSLLYS